MRILGWAIVIGVATLLPALVIASPSGPLENPPGDFAGAQYIDSAGCVYRRQGSVWAPRLDRDGTVICGYPPSLPGHGEASGDDRADLPMRLAVTLAEGLQDEDVLAGQGDEPDPGDIGQAAVQSDPLSDLASAVEAVPAMRSAAAATPGGGDRLCDLLGYQAAGPGAAPRDGSALGFCAGAAPVLQPRVVRDEQSEGSGIGTGAGVPADTKAQAAARVAASAGKRQIPAAGSRQPKPAQRTAGVEGAGRIARAAVADVEMVPAGARFVQVGRYAIPAEAEAVIRHVQEMGFPVVRGREPDTAAGGSLVMAGPLKDRQAVIVTLNFLRNAGFPRAVAR